jgi:hypothetical protein
MANLALYTASIKNLNGIRLLRLNLKAIKFFFNSSYSLLEANSETITGLVRRSQPLDFLAFSRKAGHTKFTTGTLGTPLFPTHKSIDFNHNTPTLLNYIISFISWRGNCRKGKLRGLQQ